MAPAVSACNFQVPAKANGKIETTLQVPDGLKIDASRQIVLAEVEYLASQYIEMPALLAAAVPQERQADCCANNCA